MTDFYNLGIRVDATSATKASDNLDDLTRSAERAGNEIDELSDKSRQGKRPIDNLGKGASDLDRKTSGMGRSAGQAGIQIQQMVGQVQGGVSPFVALSQQAADLGFVLGAPLVGVVVSLGAVLAGTLVAALGSTRESAGDLLERIEELSDGFRDLDESQKAFVALETQKEIDKKEELMEKLRVKISEVESELAATSERQSIFNRNNRRYQEAAPAIERQTEELVKLKAQLSSTGDEVDDLNTKLSTLGTPLASGGSVPTPTETEGPDAEARRLATLTFAYQEYAASRVESERLANQAIIDGYNQYAEARIEGEQHVANQLKIAYGEYADSRIASDAAAAENAQRLRELDIDAERKKQANIMKISQSFNSLFSDMMESQSKEIFEIGKIGAATKAVVDAYASINATIAQGGAFAWPAAIATGVAAFANVSKIMGTKYGNTSGSAGSEPSIPEPQAAASGPTQNSEVTINIAGNASQGIVDQLKELFSSDEVVIPRGSAQARELSYG